MKTLDSTTTIQPSSTGMIKHLVCRLLQQLNQGAITLVEGSVRQTYGDMHSDLHAEIHILDPQAYRRILFGGSIGAGESFVEGQWRTNDLVSLIRIFSRNLDRLKVYEDRFALISKPLHKLQHLLNRNNKKGSRTNIASHYDLSNEMYRLFLDEHMLYSSAIFPSQDSTLEEAQEFKMQQLCERLELTADDHLLEIGTGWGGLACYAAKHYGCRVTTTTISLAQYEIAQQRVADAGLQGRVTLLLDDYRDLQGQYSKIVSVEMIEAVGHRYMPSYFKMLNELLEPGGKLVLQAITINDQRYDDYCNSVDFIQRYIFPGGHLPSVGVICDQLREQTDMYLHSLQDYRQDYARTLEIWRERFTTHQDAIKALGFSDDFIRLWTFYFCYCEGAFREGVIGLAQIEAIKSTHASCHR